MRGEDLSGLVRLLGERGCLPGELRWALGLGFLPQFLQIFLE